MSLQNSNSKILRSYAAFHSQQKFLKDMKIPCPFDLNEISGQIILGH